MSKKQLLKESIDFLEEKLELLEKKKDRESLTFLGIYLPYQTVARLKGALFYEHLRESLRYVITTALNEYLDKKERELGIVFRAVDPKTVIYANQFTSSLKDKSMCKMVRGLKSLKKQLTILEQNES